MNERPLKIDALPKRFRDYVRGLEDEIKTLRALLPLNTPSRVKMVDRVNRNEERFFPDHTEVAFQIGKEWITVKIDRNDDATVEIHGNWGGLAVYPSVSNVVHVGERRRNGGG